ncbi:deiodinase-like protein [Aporhodopirellula aestuarii]|uniref:Alpha/beta hydrolase fold domain-containing protein n=1 Tax=Aporhodopirellula aestuarii TaxID=2950107 RepID=A0ABT0U962_9BACT|nr:deiodinase-like protein [Aporhodopirellula aestuarii]MCM2373411.1 alpha/beta hydrolase fold domain-containing protein [Aporhodopirellula aestuarii]
MRRLSTFCIFSLVGIVLASSVAAQRSSDRIRRWDKNNDRVLSRAEFPEQVRNRFDVLDTNGDGKVTQAEFDAFELARRNRTDRPETTENRRSASASRLKPTHANVAYGDHEKQKFDLWLAKTDNGEPTPLVIYIHGGGFRGGDKSAGNQPIDQYLDQGISFASINYRLSDVGTYPIMMHDAARCLQTIRSRAAEWNLDADRIACYGGSAGAGISLWLAFHDDLAQPDSDDPIARQSTRIVAAGTTGGQSTYDMPTFREWFGIPDLPPHPAIYAFYGIEEESDWETERVKKMMIDASPINHLTRDDPPVFMVYGSGNVPVHRDSNPGLWVHHALLGIKLKEAMDKLGIECSVTWNGNPSKRYDDIHAFLIEKVRGESDRKPQRRDTSANTRPTSRQRGRVKASGEFYAPPAMEELVPSPLKIGDRAPDFTLPQSDGGGPIALSQFQGKKPVVLVFGSITCSPFRDKVTQVFDIQRKYADKAQFLMVYIREAHPESTIMFPGEGRESVLKKFTQTDSLLARIQNAQSCTALLKVPFPLLVDAEDNGTLADYGAWPNRLVVVSKDGRIAWDSGQGPRGFQPGKLESWLQDNLR